MSVRRAMMRIALLLAAGLVFLADCRSGSRPAQHPDSAATRGLDSAAAAVVGGPAESYELLLPQRWAGHFRIDSLSTGERGRALPGALVVEYLPADSTIRPQALMALAVYDSATWREVRAEPGPPPGDSVAINGGRVYVIGLPQSNPFAPNSPDAVVFQVLQLRRAELPGLIRFR